MRMGSASYMLQPFGFNRTTSPINPLSFPGEGEILFERGLPLSNLPCASILGSLGRGRSPPLQKTSPILQGSSKGRSPFERKLFPFSYQEKGTKGIRCYDIRAWLNKKLQLQSSRTRPGINCDEKGLMLISEDKYLYRCCKREGKTCPKSILPT